MRYLVAGLVAVVLLLAGCAGLMPSKFDNVLYDKLITLSVDVDAASEKCGAPTFVDTFSALEYKSKIALKYTEYSSVDVHTSMSIIDKDVEKLVTAERLQPPPSKAYCTLTLKAINSELTALITAVGEKK